MKLGNMTSRVTFAGEYFITNRTFVWSLSFMHSGNVLIQITFLREFFITNLTFVSIAFMNTGNVAFKGLEF